MSFFDEADAPRRAPRPRRPAGGRRPPNDQQALLVRRLIASAAIVVVVILIVLGVHGCLQDQHNQALKDYGRNVASLIGQSDSEVGKPLFALLSGSSSKSPTELQNQVNQLRVVAAEQLKRAQHLDVPDQVKDAQHNFLLALKLRGDGVAQIAQLLQPALRPAGGRAAVLKIAGQMRAFDASEVVFTQEVDPLVVMALKDAGVGTGGRGEPVPNTHFLPDLNWLNADYVAQQLGSASKSATSGKPAPGTHGHQLDSVSVGSTTLQSGSTNSIPRSPSPVFTVKFTNGGSNDETNVAVKLKVTGAGQPIEVDKTVAKTYAGRQSSVQIPLTQLPAAGQQVTVTVSVAGVPGEKDFSNNTQTYPATFG